MSAEQLKLLFSTPLALLGLMFFGALLSAAKQLAVARRQGATVSISEYFLKIETVITLCVTFAAWLGLLFSDTLNPLAIFAGYFANDIADAATKSGRSSAIMPSDAEAEAATAKGS